jgi:uncharacterized protein YjiS (DUF1127 family)
MPGLKQVPPLIGQNAGSALESRAAGPGRVACDFVAMSAEQQHDEVHRLIRAAHAARTRLMHATTRRVLAWLRGTASVAGRVISDLAMRLIAAVVRGCRAYIQRRQLMRAAAELGGMTDRELKDIGVHRSAIDWVVTHGRDGQPASAASIGRPVLLRNAAPAKPAKTSALSEAATQKRRAA